MSIDDAANAQDDAGILFQPHGSQVVHKRECQPADQQCSAKQTIPPPVWRLSGQLSADHFDGPLHSPS